jgi:hypothetical protein
VQHPSFFARSLASLWRRSLLVRIGLVVAISVTGLNASTPSKADAATPRPFSPTSFYNQELPASTPTDPKSDLFVADIQDQIKTYYGNVAINTTQFAPPVYVVDAGVPTIAVKSSNCQGTGINAGFVEQMSAVPMPANAIASAGTDKEMVIWQPSTDQLWEMWKAENRADGWYACWGGRMQNVSTSDGVFPSYYGVAATSLSLLGGLMTIEELQRGVIDHAIAFSLVRTRKYVYSYPAHRTDGAYDDVNAIPEGQRFRLDPTLNVDAMNISPMAKMVAKAMQKYGAVVRDKSGSVALYGENPMPLVNAGQTNPYNAIFAGKPSYQVMNGFPWNRMQALPFDYGKDGVQQSGTPATFAAASTAVGYRAVTADGGVHSFGDVSDKGSAKAGSPVVGMSTTKSRAGYWLASANGSTYSFGDAVNFGSMSGKKLNAPIVGVSAQPDANGYYLLGKDGGVFAFGNAPFYGSTGSIKLNQPVVGMSTTPSGKGYWFVAADGGVFAYGDAAFCGSMGGSPLNKPIVGLASTPSGKGYWLVASDGGIFAFGDAAFYGSTGNITLNKPITGMASTPSGKGYRFVASDGGIFSFGDASFQGSLASANLASPVVALSN